jgi:hypothetical protein
MDTEYLKELAFSYSKERDFNKIQVKWNGKNGKEFDDENDDFRVQLCQFIIPQIDKVNIELIRDLYIEFAKTSEATFGVFMDLNILAQELLTRGGTTYLMDYLKGASHTMDTYMRAGQIHISKDLAREIFSYSAARLLGPIAIT